MNVQLDEEQKNNQGRSTRLCNKMDDKEGHLKNKYDVRGERVHNKKRKMSK